MTLRPQHGHRLFNSQPCWHCNRWPQLRQQCTSSKVGHGPLAFKPNSQPRSRVGWTWVFPRKELGGCAQNFPLTSRRNPRKTSNQNGSSLEQSLAPSSYTAGFPPPMSLAEQAVPSRLPCTEDKNDQDMFPVEPVGLGISLVKLRCVCFNDSATY